MLSTCTVSATGTPSCSKSRATFGELSFRVAQIVAVHESAGKSGNQRRRSRGIVREAPVGLCGCPLWKGSAPPTGALVSEVLQGLTRDVAAIEEFLAQWELLQPSGLQTYPRAATIFRTARGKGISFTTIDTIIAAVALQHRASLFTVDHDFSQIVPMTGLVLYRF